MTREDIKSLAALARIRLSDAEAAAYAEECQSILGYVEQVKEIASADLTPTVGDHTGILREDVPTHEPGAYTEALLDAAPDRKDRYVRVKKILGTEE